MNKYKIVSKKGNFAFSSFIEAKSEMEAKILLHIEVLETYLKYISMFDEDDIMLDPYDYINNYKIILEEENIEKDKKEKLMENKNYPNLGDKYYLINSFGDVVEATWGEDNFELKEWDMGFGSFTEEEANFKKQNFLIKKEMESFAKDFEYGVKNYYFAWDYTNNHIRFLHSTELKGPYLYFESKEKIEEMLEALGEERVKKYYLGV